MTDRLAQLPLFNDLDRNALAHLASLSRILHFERKQTIFSEGEPYRGMFVVLSGLAVVFKLSAEGRMLIVNVCRPSDPLAEITLFEKEDAGYAAHAKTTRDSEILFLPRDPFLAFVRSHPSVAWRMLQGFAARVKELTLQLEGVTLREDGSRFARYLLREIEAGGVSHMEHPELTLPLAKSSVASYLGTVHETLSRTLTRLIREKIIAVDGPRITVLDKSRLERLV